MANEEITISELELADEVLADMVLAVDTTTDTRAVTLRQLKAWLGSSLPTGFILPAVGKISDERFTLLDGKTLARTGTYEAFCNKVIEQVQAGNWFSCTEAEFNQDVADFGQCGRFVITNDYVRIPLITRYIGATVTLSEIGRTYAESLPNIKGRLGLEGSGDQQEVGGCVYIDNNDTNITMAHNVAVTGYANRKIDASLSSSTYQDNAKVNPEHTKFPYYMVVSTEGQQEEIEVDINEVYEDLNLKANTDLSNVNPASSFKQASIGWGMPDYSAGVSFVSGSTVQVNGWMYYFSFPDADRNTISIDNVNIMTQTPAYYNEHCGLFPVSAGQIVSVNIPENTNFTFYPCKGVN